MYLTIFIPPNTKATQGCYDFNLCLNFSSSFSHGTDFHPFITNDDKMQK